MKSKQQPVRLAKKQDEMEYMKEILNADIVFKIKFYALMIILMLILFFIISIIQPQTYGYINW